MNILPERVKTADSLSPGDSDREREKDGEWEMKHR
jgi:hypothetical protein